MSIQEQITRIQTDRNTIRTKLVELGLASGTDNLDVLAQAVDGIENRGNVTVQVKEGETYTIPAGWHGGTGTVSGVAGGGNYNLQSKTVTPTKAAQSITNDEGFYGLSDVTVNAIPDEYQIVTDVDATAADVLTGKTIVNALGQVIAGTMVNNGAVNKTLDTTTKTYTVPKGYHDGKGAVKVVTEEKSATPTKSEQTINATAGKVISKVIVAAIPAAYQDVTAVTAGAADVLDGEVIVGADGTEIEGTMPNNGAVSKTLTPSDTSLTIAKGYHDGTGKVQIVPETKSVTPTKAQQTVTPTNGKVLSKVTVDAIPDEYQVVTGVTAGAADVLDGKFIVDATGAKIEGTMTNNGAVSASIDGLTTVSYTIPAGYHSGTGKVSLTNDIETLLAAI